MESNETRKIYYFSIFQQIRLKKKWRFRGRNIRLSWLAQSRSSRCNVPLLNKKLTMIFSFFWANYVTGPWSITSIDVDTLSRDWTPSFEEEGVGSQAEYYSVATEIRNNERRRNKRKKKKRSISSLSGRGNKLRLSRISFHGRDGRDLVLFGSSQEISKTFAKISPLFPL